MKKIPVSLALVLLGMSLTVSLSQAGGWAVVTLDALPKNVIAGEPFTVGFMVRQHGRTPMGGLRPPPTLALWPANPSKIVAVEAADAGEKGHYSATVNLPSSGTWKWTVRAFGAQDQPLPPLTVLDKEAGSASVGSPVPPPVMPAAPVVPLPLIIGLIGAIGSIGAIIIWKRTAAGPALATAAAGAMIATTGVGLFVFQTAPAEAQAAVQPAVIQPAVGQPDKAQMGGQLFIAKGCIVCHVNGAVKEAIGNFTSFNVGPDLTHITDGRADVEGYRLWLEKWLWNPSLLKPQAEMPTLGLSEAEISALAVFLTSTAPK
ncbi:MAG: c-type cytochrome [Chloroflexi bacterium]|nr:c-type cytochrome [Chloroflexota bacterium]